MLFLTVNCPLFAFMYNSTLKNLGKCLFRKMCVCKNERKKKGLKQEKLRHFSMTKLFISETEVSLLMRLSEGNKCDHKKKERLFDELLRMDENCEAD